MTLHAEQPYKNNRGQSLLHLGFGLVALGLILYRVLLIFSYNGEIGGIDNNFVYAVIRGMNGYPIYPDPESAPYAVNPYAPLYYSFCIGLGKLFAIDTREPIHVYWLCRSFSLICDMLTLFLVYRLIRVKKRIPGTIAFPATLVLGLLLTYLGYTLSRVDSLYLLCYVAVFFFLHSDRFSKPLLRLAVVAFLSVAAIFSKQSGIALPLLVSLWLFFAGEKKRIAAYLLFTLGFVFLFYSYYVQVRGNTFLLAHTFKGIRNHLDPSWFYIHVFKRTVDSLWILLLYFPLMISIRRLKGQVPGMDRGLALVFIGQTLFSLATTLKWGSTPGYFHESFFLGSLLIAEWVSSKNPDLIRKASRWLLPLLWLFTVHVLAQGYLFYLQNQSGKKKVYQEQKQIRDYVGARLGDRLVFDLGQQNSNFFKNLFPAQAAVPNFDAVDCCTLPDGNFDYEGLKKDLQNGRIGYLLIPVTDSIPSIWGISLNRYVTDTILHGQRICRYRGE